MAGRFEELFTQHRTIAADLLDAAKKGEVSKAVAIRNRWYKNADEIAGFLASVNPCWDKARWKDMLVQSSGNDGGRSSSALPGGLHS